MNNKLFIFLLIVLTLSCKETKKEKEAIVLEETPEAVEEGNNHNNDKVSEKKNLDTTKTIKNHEPIVFSYTDKETNDFQELKIQWEQYKKSFNFDLTMGNDLCEYKDKGYAVLIKNNSFKVQDHPRILEIEFISNYNQAKLTCEYGEVRDECDPIEEFVMRKN